MANGETRIRDADPSEVDRLADIWHAGFRDAHAEILPAELVSARTRESFRERLAAGLPSVRVAGAPGAPLGFHWLRDAELYQLYVSRTARGSGVAAALMADAEARLAERGVGVARLGCAIGNDRAARFYEKCGWRLAGVVREEVETAAGVVALDAWRYEKDLKVGP